ncbi:MAG: hypothetical protein P0Y55_12960 [Candidatus Cohnella colombiensis]|uniref:Glycosyl transferase n=1 Tax=Candidatus Cohnella colombiensis TaxID=3121368 RepID=A0AA95EX03_9BACL|nr:MAG: hypothetical protein P0Y55_12960 [Cohnella sp.]
MLAEHHFMYPESPPSFTHLRRLTDDTGLLEHAVGRIPRRREGYTADDNARALWTVTEWLSRSPKELNVDDRTELLRLSDVYLAYLLWSQRENGWLHNNYAYDRTPELEQLSHDCQGRSIWACVDAWIRLDGPSRDTARIIVERAMPTLSQIDSHRGQAYTMAACAHLLGASEQGLIALPESMYVHCKQQLVRLEQLLNDAFNHFTDDNWRWFEPAMTYGNGVLPWAMLRTFRYTTRSDTLHTGLLSLSFLLKVMTADEGWLRPIGNECWYTSERTSRWDQQPLEMFKLALALNEAIQALQEMQPVHSLASVKSKAITHIAGYTNGHPRSTGFEASVSGTTLYTDVSQYRTQLTLCRSWYYGNNDLGMPMIDSFDGSCCDGLTQNGPNINCGAEATLSYLMTEALSRPR